LPNYKLVSAPVIPEFTISTKITGWTIAYVHSYAIRPASPKVNDFLAMPDARILIRKFQLRLDMLIAKAAVNQPRENMREL
jgi:hypothetical protein